MICVLTCPEGPATTLSVRPHSTQDDRGHADDHEEHADRT
jgi:hypothetical protein